MMRRKKPPTTIFSPHNVEAVKRFCKQGLRIETLLEKEIERITRENTFGDEKREAVKLEIIKRHRETVSKISEARLDLALIMQSIGVDVHK